MPNPVRFSEVKSTKPSMRVRDVTISNSTTPGGLGPTEVTGFWNTVSVPPSGYIVYEKKAENGPSIMVHYNKEDTVERLYLMFPQALRDIYDLPEYARLPFAVSYANTQNGVLVVNKDFPEVPLVGLVCNIDPTFLMSYPRTGNTINDISNDGDNDGTLVDVGWGAEIDGCLILNGTTSYIDLGSGPDFDFGTNDFSISVWFRMDASPIDSSPVILGKGTTGATGIVMYVLDNAIAVNIDNSNGLYDLKSTSTINDNDWHNIVVIRKGDVYQLIVDTYEEVNITLTGKTITTKDTMLVGKYGDNTKYFDGKIGPIQIYNRALYARIAPPTTNLNSYFDNGTDPNGDPIPESIVDWDTRNVTNMSGTFKFASDFNLDISGWDTSNVTNMVEIFRESSSFNQDIGNWDVSKISSMYLLFFNASSFNNGGSPSINDWNTSNVTTMELMFTSTQFNQPIGSWDTSKVINMRGMFSSTPFDQNIGNWDVSKVTNMVDMFINSDFNNGGSPSISGWTTSGVTRMDRLFYNNKDFNQPIGSWDTSNVTNMEWIFRESSFNQDIGNWDVSNITNMYAFFFNSPPFNNGGSPSISAWTTSDVTTMEYMFTSTQFNQPIGSWDTSKVINMRGMFTSAPFDQDIGNWDVSKVTNMISMFNNSDFNNGGSPSISGWTTSGVTRMDFLFYNTPFNQPIGSWDTSNVTNMNWIFRESSFNQDIGNWDVSNITDMYAFFFNSPFNNGGSPSISAWTTSNVTTMEYMFLNTQFNHQIGSWDISSVTNMNGMFNNSGMSTENYSNTLIGWAAQAPNIQSNVPLGSSAKYNAYAAEARDLLTGTYGWTITDAGIDEDIVMDGLVFSVDAGNTTSYVSGSTTWNDLVGDNDGTLVNGPTFDSNNRGSIVFDGSDDSVILTNDQIYLTPTFTLEYWAKLYKDGSRHIVFVNWRRYSMEVYNNLSPYITWNNGTSQPQTPRSATMVEGEWTHVLSLYDGTTFKSYMNGVFVSQSTDVFVGNGGTMRISGTPFSGGAVNGNISMVRQYNRALTPSEILQNYNAQKGRFGL